MAPDSILSLGGHRLAFYTPRGLKIRMDVPYAFTLMSRLYPKVAPAKVLETTEAFDEVPVAACHLVALVCLVSGFQMSTTVVATAVGAAVGYFLLSTGLWIPGLLTLSNVFSKLTFLVRIPAMFIVGYLAQGWAGVVAWGLAYLAASIVGTVAGFMTARSAHKATGFALTTSEMSFFNAFRLHAVALGAASSTEVTQEEQDSGKWQAVAEDYGFKFPGRLPSV